MAEIDQLLLNTFVLVPANGTRKLGIVVGRRVGGEIEGSFPAPGLDGDQDMVQVLIPTALTVDYQTTGMCCFPMTADLATPDQIQAGSDKSWMRTFRGYPAIRLQDRGDVVVIRLMSSGDTTTMSKFEWLSLPIAT